MGYIYLIENIINNKKYIGQTKCDDIQKRWKQHKKIDKKSIGTCLFNAYKKYGINNFNFKIICICFDSDTDRYEIDYIKKYNTIYPNGYNLQSGGNNRKHNNYTIELIREKLKGEKSPNYGKKLSLETRQKISASLKGEKHPNYNKPMSIEQKNKIKNTMKNFTQERRKIINETISNSLKNNIQRGVNNKLSKKICQYDLNGKLIKIHDSISQASNEVNVDRMTISRCCDDKYKNYKTSKGFIWKYYKNN
jgi:group I intron endonuclease